MQCDNTYLTLLSGHLDGCNSETEEKRLQKHLKSCRHCRELLQSLEEADILLAQNAAEPPADLTARIMTAVKAEPKKKVSRKRYYFSTAVAGLAAAAVLCFALLGDNLPLLPEKTAEDAADHIVYEYAEEASCENIQGTTKHSGVADNIDEGSFSYASPSQVEAATSSDVELTEGIPPTAAPTQAPVESTAPTQAPTEPREVDATTAPPETAAPVTEAPPEPSAQTEPPEEIAETTEPFALPPLSKEGSDPGYSPQTDVHSSYRSPISGNTEPEPAVPTLVIWGISVEDLRLPFSAQKTEFTEQTDSRGSDSLYKRFASALSQMRKPSSPLGKLNLAPVFDAEIYTLTYEDLRDLFDDCVTKWELAFYLPKEIRDLDHCQVILMGVSQDAEEAVFKSARE